MGLLWIEGFEGFGTTDDVAPAPTGILGRKYPITVRESFMEIQSGRYGKCLQILGTLDYLQSPNLTTNATSVFGMAVKMLATPVPPYTPLVALYDGATEGINFQFNQDGTISAYRASSLLGTTVNAMALNTWYYFEAKVLTHNSSGTIDIHVNGASWLSLSGIDTQESANAYHTAFRLGEVEVKTQFDDIYFLDASGTENNDFLGNRKVEVIRPNGAGDSTDWTPDSGSNYDRVNEAELDEDTSYVETDTTTDKDLYTYGNLVNMNEVDGIQIMTEVKVTAGDMDLHSVIKSSTTESDGSGDTIISTDYVTSRRLEELNPHTAAAWTPSEVDAAQFGVKAI